jgi:hypothetical protein
MKKVTDVNGYNMIFPLEDTSKPDQINGKQMFLKENPWNR